MWQSQEPNPGFTSNCMFLAKAVRSIPSSKGHKTMSLFSPNASPLALGLLSHRHLPLLSQNSKTVLLRGIDLLDWSKDKGSQPPTRSHLIQAPLLLEPPRVWEHERNSMFPPSKTWAKRNLLSKPPQLEEARGKGVGEPSRWKVLGTQAGVHCMQYREEVSKGLMEKESPDGVR